MGKYINFGISMIIIIIISLAIPLTLISIYGIEGEGIYNRQLGQNEREKAINETLLTYDNYRLTLTYKSYYVTLMPYVIYNGNYFTLEDLITQFPAITQDIEIDINYDNYKFALNISNIPLNRQANINYIGLERIDTNLLGSDIELGTYTICLPETSSNCINYNADYILFRNKVKMDYSDVLSKFTYSLNKTHVEFGNITANIINNSVYIDPNIQLQTPDTENLEDTYVDSNFPTTNYGAGTTFSIDNVTGTNSRRSYIKFNLSSIINAVNFSSITNATLYLYFESENPVVGDRNVTTHYVNNTIWLENIITWNNQPCGNTIQTLNASCNNTPTDWSLLLDGVFTWHNWNVTDIVTQYNTTDNYISIGIFTDIGNGDNVEDVVKLFSSKESATPSQRPILNVTYTLTNATTTTTTTVTGITTTTYNLTTTRTLSLITLNLDENLITFIRYIYIALILFTFVLLIEIYDIFSGGKIKGRLKRNE